MVNSYYHKNILKTSGFLRASKSCILLEVLLYFIQELSGKEHQYTTSSFLFFLKKAMLKKQKKSSTLII